MNIGELWKLYEEQHLVNTRSPERAHYAWQNLRLAFSDLTSKEITAQRWNDYLIKRTQEGASSGTINREQQSLNAMLRWCARAGYVTGTSPYLARKPNPPPRQRVLSEDEIIRLQEAARWDRPVFDFIRIALLTAQRREAITSLTWDQIDLDRNTIDFNDYEQKAFMRMKGRAYMPMPKELGDLLREIKDRYTADGKYVLEKRTNDYINRGFKKAADRAGLSDVTPHTIRHTVATQLVHRGVPLLQVSRLLGHRDMRTTEKVYVKLSPEFLGDVAQQLTLGGDDGRRSQRGNDPSR